MSEAGLLFKRYVWLIDTILVSNLVSDCSTLKGRIQYEHIPSGQVWLTAIIKAMKQNNPIEITYKGFRGRGEHTFTMPEDFHPDEYFEDCYGIIHDDEQETQTVRIKVIGNQAKYEQLLFKS